MADATVLAHKSVLITPPTVPVSGLFHNLLRGDAFVAAVALSASLSTVLTVALANIPFQIIQVHLGVLVCFYISFGILSLMIITLVFVFFHKQPDLPVSPGTLAGALYYVRDSGTSELFADLSTMSRKSRNNFVEGLRLRYTLTGARDKYGGSQLGVQAT